MFEPNKRLRKNLLRSGVIGLLAVSVYRFGHWVYGMRTCILRKALWLFYMILDLVVVKALANAEISADCVIASGVTFVHNANGVIIGGGATIGENTEIYHQTTIGVINGNRNGPVIGKNVFIGCGAKILGPITVGDDAKIGAGAVVIDDVPPRATAVGVPAKILVKEKSLESGVIEQDDTLER